VLACNTRASHRGQYWGADKSLVQPGRNQARKHVRDARDFNNIETRAFVKFVFLQGKVPKEIHAILKETLACFLPGRAKDLPAPLYQCNNADTPTRTDVQFRWTRIMKEISTEILHFVQLCPIPVVWANLCLLFLRQVWDFCVGENLEWGRQGKKMEEAGASETSGLT
jgi:hypothetical protein